MADSGTPLLSETKGGSSGSNDGGASSSDDGAAESKEVAGGMVVGDVEGPARPRNDDLGVVATVVVARKRIMTPDMAATLI